jgi:hypothetical protein
VILATVNEAVSVFILLASLSEFHLIKPLVKMVIL